MDGRTCFTKWSQVRERSRRTYRSYNSFNPSDWLNINCGEVLIQYDTTLMHVFAEARFARDNRPAERFGEKTEGLCRGA